LIKILFSCSVIAQERNPHNKIYQWKYPVHEILSTDQNEKFIELTNLQVNHHADNTKSRSSYLPLLELASQENPQDDRTMHYLGREYMFYGEYDKAIKTLNHHLSLPSATWNEERCASLRYIANCYKMKNDKKEAENHYILAIIEDNSVRESYYELGQFYFENKDYIRSIFVFEQMLKISTRKLSYISSPVCWGSLPYDYLSLAYFELGNYKKAISNVEIAIKLNDDIRLKRNKEFFIQASMNQTES